MEYLKAAVTLNSLIKQANTTLLVNIADSIKSPNFMLIQSRENHSQTILMDSFTNEFVKATLASTNSEAFVITDLASMDVNGNKVSYFLYKGYHSLIPQGMVFYQVIDLDNLTPTGALQFSNMEANIFYTVVEPQAEESSCNAMETNKVIENGKSIVFFIGNIHEERLLHDIQRLIVDTIHNIKKHNKLAFQFIIHIERYGKKPSQQFREAILALDAFTKIHIYPEYPNANFEFAYDGEDSWVN